MTTWHVHSIEDLTLERLAHVAAVRRYVSRSLTLSPVHRRVMHYDQQFLRDKRGYRSHHFDDYRISWIAMRARVSVLEVETLLQEAAMILEARDYEGLDIDWAYETTGVERINQRQIERAMDRAGR